MDYRIVAGYVTVETALPDGSGRRAQVDIPRGELLPADVPDEQRLKLLDLGSVTPAEAGTLPGPAAGGADHVDDDPGGDKPEGEDLDAVGADEVVVDPEPEATPARATAPRKRTAK